MRFEATEFLKGVTLTTCRPMEGWLAMSARRGFAHYRSEAGRHGHYPKVDFQAWVRLVLVDQFIVTATNSPTFIRVTWPEQAQFEHIGGDELLDLEDVVRLPISVLCQRLRDRHAGIDGDDDGPQTMARFFALLHQKWAGAVDVNACVV